MKWLDRLVGFSKEREEKRDRELAEWIARNPEQVIGYIKGLENSAFMRPWGQW